MSWQPVAEPARRRAALGGAILIAAALLAPRLAAAQSKPAGTKPESKPAAAATTPAPKSGGSVVGRVNGRAISRRDFDLMVQVQFRQRGPGERRHDDLEAVRASALDALIDAELLYQKAQEAKVTVSESEVKAESERLKTLLGGPDEAAAFLKDAGLEMKDLDDQVRRNLVVKKFIDTGVAKGIEVTDAQAKAWYDAHPEAVSRPESVRISQIVVPVASTATANQRADARQKAEAILKEIQGGKDFGEMARLHGDGPEAKRGGDAGWIWAGGGALPVIERAALALKPGQMSDIVESRRGYHLMKATDRRPAGPVPFDEAKAGVIERMSAEARDEKLRLYLADLRRKATIEKSL
ncbi:MAG TPA: peptidylprolyl isomerase [Candidatus Polarisedimenticolia bacterium]|nr:peptidylprolyl isomerase [Candidatus Polarisedimenticolia bacterium]